MDISIRAWSAMGYMNWTAQVVDDTAEGSPVVARFAGHYEMADAPLYEDEIWYLADQVQDALEDLSVRP